MLMYTQGMGHRMLAILTSSVPASTPSWLPRFLHSERTSHVILLTSFSVKPPDGIRLELSYDALYMHR